MNCGNCNPYVSHVDNVVPGKPAGEPRSSQDMDRQRQQRAVQGDQRSHYRRVGRALVSILRYGPEDRNRWLTIDELLHELRRARARSEVECVLAADTKRFLCRRREVDESGWAEYEYTARPRKQR